MKRTRLRPVSTKRSKLLDLYRQLLELIGLSAAWDYCARCGTFCSPDPHHPYKRGQGRRSAWKTLCVVPLCRCCHNWVHENETQAREDGWLPKPKTVSKFEPV